MKGKRYKVSGVDKKTWIKNDIWEIFYVMSCYFFVNIINTINLVITYFLII